MRRGADGPRRYNCMLRSLQCPPPLCLHHLRLVMDPEIVFVIRVLDSRSIENSVREPGFCQALVRVRSASGAAGAQVQALVVMLQRAPGGGNKGF